MGGTEGGGSLGLAPSIRYALFMMTSIAPIITGIGIVVHLAVLVTRRAEAWRRFKTIIAVADIAVIIGSIITFGWIGAVLAVLVLILSFLVSSIRLGWTHERILVEAITRGRLDMDRGEAKSFARELRCSHRHCGMLGPLGMAHLIRVLSECGRSDFEIRRMALPLAQMIHVQGFEGADRERVIDKFDRLLRVTGKPADEATSTMDTLMATTKQSRARFEELLDGMIAVYEPVERD